MPASNLQKIVKVTQAQYNTLASGGTVGDYTGLNDNYIYLVQDGGTSISDIRVNGTSVLSNGVADIPTVIDVTNGITAAIKAKVQKNPGTILFYQEYYYVPQYAGSPSTIPEYYNCFEGDSHNFRYLMINWDDLSLSYEEVDYAVHIKSLKTDNTTAQSTSASESISGNGTINLHKVSKTGSYNDLLNKPTIPTVNNATLTIQNNGATVNTFTANASSNVTANIQTPTIRRFI